MTDVIDKLARKLVIAEERLMMQEHFPPLEEAPHSLTNRTDHLPYVIWIFDPHYDGDKFPWKCQAALRSSVDAHCLVEAYCKRRLAIVLQTPTLCEEITP